MKAYEVTISMTVRVIAENEREARRTAVYKAVENMHSHGGEFVDEIKEDLEDPYDGEEWTEL